MKPKKIQKRVSLMKKIEQYEIADGKIVRKRQFCPKEECGPGVFLAVHKDRVSCGKCGYTKFND